VIQKTLRCAKKTITVNIPKKNLFYSIEPNNPKIMKNETDISKTLEEPISSLPLSNQVKSGMKVVVLVDDITRPTPHKKILPILLRELNKAGIKDKDITLLIALGTHRYMTQEEITERFGEETTSRVKILNNEWKDQKQFINIGDTENKTSVIVNRRVYEADYVIGVGIIATHDLAGWSGGGKIIQPGVCSWETTQATHLLAARHDLIGALGNAENSVRKEIELVAKKVGLNFILNVVLDSKENLIEIVSGDPVKAHREGAKYARPIYEQDIPGLADIVITNAYPADLDYWQGIKPLLLSQKGLKEKGTLILIGEFSEGISPTHPELKKYGDRTYKDVEKLFAKGEIRDGVCAAALMEHVQCTERTKVICVSDGLSFEEKLNLNFVPTANIEDALEIAFEQQGANAKIGIIEYGGDVIPQVKS